MRRDPARWAARRHGPRGAYRRGVTLIELLVAISVSAIVLAAAWPWLWNGISTARATEARAEAATAAAYVVRAISSDVALATDLLPLPAGIPATRAVRLEHRHPGQGAEEILIVWDPARQVLWRKSAGSYLADRVALFSIEYLDAQGAPQGPETGSSGDWLGSVRRLRVRVTVTSRGQRSSAECDAPVGPL